MRPPPFVTQGERSAAATWQGVSVLVGGGEPSATED